MFDITPEDYFNRLPYKSKDGVIATEVWGIENLSYKNFDVHCHWASVINILGP